MPTTQEIFETIYRKKLWGGRKRFWQRFYSGSGSADQDIIGPYIKAVTPLVVGKNVVDLGCGDFTVGNRLVAITEQYTGCDIARPLIEFNRRKFRSSNLTFCVLNAVEDPLPVGDVVLIRQVLQHLSNDSVSKLIVKLKQYPVAVVTEHVPSYSFVPNIDMPTGAGNRTLLQSGLVLIEPPFNLVARSTRVVCEVPKHGGLIRSILYEF